MMIAKVSQFYHFGPFRLDPAEHLLWRNGKPIVLPPKVLATLTALVENSGHLLTKEDLMNAVWPNSVVEENNLAVNISVLRKLFREFNFIETVPRTGYRFAAGVRVVAGAALDCAGESASAPLPAGENNTAGKPESVARQSVNGGARGARRATLLAACTALVALAAWVLFAVDIRQEPAGTSAALVTLAVLPFEDLSGDPDQQYLADGITDALIGELARIGRLRVISRTSAMSYKESSKPLPEIGRELGANAVIEGTIQQSGERVRVRVQLIEVATDHHLWVDSFDRDVSDILTLQSEIAQTIAGEVSVKVDPAERSRLSVPRPVDRRAFDDYLQGSHYLGKLNKTDIEKAIRLFERAIGQDRSFAPAYVGLARSYNLLGKVMVAGMPSVVASGKAAAMVKKALQIDPDLSEAHAILASIDHFNWNWAEAERGFQKAIALNSSSSTARSGYALYLSSLGRFEEALAEIDQALRLDPRSIGLRWTAALIAYEARRYDEATGTLRQIVEIAPGFEHAYWLLGLVHLARGETPEAIAVLERARKFLPEQLSILSVLGMAYGRVGRSAEALQLLDELAERAGHQYVPAGNFVDIYLGLGDHDSTFQWLERAFEERSPYVTNIRVLPEVDPIRADPRFASLVRRVSLPASRMYQTRSAVADR